MKHLWRQTGTRKDDYTNPVGVTYFTLGFQPGDKKHITGFGGIFAFFAKIVTKPNELNIKKHEIING